MKKFRRVKVINKQQYVYEIEPYYDKTTKKIRQKSKYIGKFKGNLDTAEKVRKYLPKQCYSYGEFLPFYQLINDLNLKNILQDIIGKKDSETVLGIAMNKIINPVALHLIDCWYNGTILTKKYPEMIYKSQSLSNFLKRIGTIEIIQKIIHKIIETNKCGSSLIYDITSLTSFSKSMPIFEYGYNRNKDGLPQINYLLVVDKENEMPLMYDINPGSIPDVRTLNQTIKKLNSYGITDNTIVLDRGFFSNYNLNNLINKSNFSFIIPGSLSNKNIKNKIIKTQIELPRYLKKINSGRIFSKSVSIFIGKNKIKGYLYYSLEKAEQEKQLFYQKLSSYSSLIEEELIKNNSDANNTIKSIVPTPFLKYYIWNNKTNKLEYVEKEIAQKIKKLGKFILLYNKNKLSWQECLNTYNEKIMIEKSFDMLKNDLEALRLNVQSEEAMSGLLLIYFISLIFRMKLNYLLKKSELNKKYTLEMILLELSKIKQIELENGEVITTVLTKKQREILKHYKDFKNLCA